MEKVRRGYPWSRGLQRVRVSMPTIEQRFWPQVDRNGPVSEARPDLGPCWVWKGLLWNHGYGRFWMLGKWRTAHRVSYELLRTLIPYGLEPDHLCRVRACVHPWHLELVTRRVNCLRGEGPRLTHERYASKTTCANGHERNSENVRMHGRNRRCRACERMWAKEHRDRRNNASR